MKKELFLSLIAVLGLVAIISGATYAFFTFSKTGSTENVIRSGSIAFHYDEISGKGRGINLIDALPVDSDEDAKELNDYFDFRITANSSIAEIPYVIAAHLSDDSNMPLNVVKIYLTKVEGANEEEVLYTTLNTLEQKQFLNSIDKVLYREIVPVNGQSYEVNYRLRMWIAEGTDYSTGLYNNKRLSLTVNVYTNEGSRLTEDNLTKPNDTSIKMISANNTYLLTETDENNIDYEVTVPNEVNTVNFDITTRNIAATTNVTELGPVLSYKDGYIKRMSNSSTYNLLVGDNYFRVTTTAADGETTEDYTLKVNREPSKDNNLTYLGVQGYSFTEEFDKDTTTYHVTLESNSINIIGNKSSDVASITGTGTKNNLVWGENTFQVTVTPEDPNTSPKVYTIIVNNQRPEAPDITGGDETIWISPSRTITINEPGTAISGVTGYEYYKTTSTTLPAEDTQATGTLTTTPYLLEVSDEGTTYIYYRTVSTNGNKSLWSSSEVVKVDNGPTIATLTSAPSTKNQITANYTATTSISDIKDIKCYYGTTNNPTTEVSPTGNNCVFTGLTQDTTYYFKKCTTSNSNATTCSEVSSKPTAGHVYQFNYNGTTGSDGSVQSWTIPYTGTYKLEAYGAQGGTATAGSYTGNGGKGAYVYGTTTLTANAQLYIAVGGQPTAVVYSSPPSSNVNVPGGYNGGGNGTLGGNNAVANQNGTRGAGGGGGATSISYINGTIGTSITTNNVTQTLIIAGAGGGGGALDGQVANMARDGANSGILECQFASYPVCETITLTISTNGTKRTLSGGSGGGYQTTTGTSSGNAFGGPGSGATSYNTINATVQEGVRSGHGYAQITVESID